MRGHQALIYTAVFSPDGTRVLTASRDGTARIFDARTGWAAPRAQARAPMSRASTDRAVFSPDSTRVVTASIDGTARIWTAAGGLLHVLNGGTGPVYRAVFSPDGKLSPRRRAMTRPRSGTPQPAAGLPPSVGTPLL